MEGRLSCYPLLSDDVAIVLTNLLIANILYI